MHTQSQQTGGGPSVPHALLTMGEREEIRAGIERGESFAQIARILDRPTSTISREVGKNGGTKKYSATRAHDQARRKRRRPKTPKLLANPRLRDEVHRRLKEEKLSPEVISRQLIEEGIGSVSTETIYSSIYAQGLRGLPAGLHKSLHRSRRCRKHRRKNGEPTGKASPLGVFNLIHLRPSIASLRTQIGHWEGDLILGAANRSAVVTLIDRASYYAILGELPFGHNADEVLLTLTQMFSRVPEELRRTLTWDQGREMARHAEMSKHVGIDIFFCDPHSPWQRPSNENFNGLVRRWLPKGSDLSVHSQADLDVIANRINNMPRRNINYDTAADRYNLAVVALTA